MGQIIYRYMKFLKRRNKFLNEATIGEVIHPRQAEEVESKWGKEFLSQEQIKPTKNIPEMDVVLDEDDRMKILGAFFDVKMKDMYDMFGKLPKIFVKTLNESVNLDLLSKQNSVQPDKAVSIMENFDISKPTIDAITILSKPIFSKISVGDTKKPTGTEIIDKDSNGVPKRDENNNIIKRIKEEGEVIYSRNLVNINTFVDDYNDCFPGDKVNASIFSSGEVGSVINLAAEDFSQGAYDVGYSPFSKQMRLKIIHDPSHILNMSISKYYSSCQQLYTGMYRSKVIGNVFDPNTLPAFIIFDTPIKWKGNVISDNLPLCRMMIRNLEGFDPNNNKIFFDRCYPDRCKDAMDEIVEKYTGLKSTAGRGDAYYFTPDLPEELAATIDTPYMDRLSIETKRYIGVNTKSITLTPNIDWSEVRVSKEAKLKEIIIQTTNLPDGLLDIPMKPDWIKFKYMELMDLSIFSKLKSDSYGFTKCELNNNLLSGLPETTKKLQLTNCKFTDLDFSSIKDLEELQLLFTMSKQQFISNLSNLKLKKLVVSTDIMDNQNLAFVKELRKKGTVVEFHGPGADKLNKSK